MRLAPRSCSIYVALFGSGPFLRRSEALWLCPPKEDQVPAKNRAPVNVAHLFSYMPAW